MLTLVQTKQKERSVDRDKSLKLYVLCLPTHTHAQEHEREEQISLWHKLTHHNWVVMWGTLLKDKKYVLDLATLERENDDTTIEIPNETTGN